MNVKKTQLRLILKYAKAANYSSPLKHIKDIALLATSNSTINPGNSNSPKKKRPRQKISPPASLKNQSRARRSNRKPKSVSLIANDALIAEGRLVCWESNANAVSYSAISIGCHRITIAVMTTKMQVGRSWRSKW